MGIFIERAARVFGFGEGLVAVAEVELEVADVDVGAGFGAVLVEEEGPFPDIRLSVYLADSLLWTH